MLTTWPGYIIKSPIIAFRSSLELKNAEIQGCIFDVIISYYVETSQKMHSVSCLLWTWLITCFSAPNLRLRLISVSHNRKNKYKRDRNVFVWRNGDMQINLFLAHKRRVIPSLYLILFCTYLQKFFNFWALYSTLYIFKHVLRSCATYSKVYSTILSLGSSSSQLLH
jgi:hypothetical protein